MVSSGGLVVFSSMEAMEVVVLAVVGLSVVIGAALLVDGSGMVVAAVTVVVAEMVSWTGVELLLGGTVITVVIPVEGVEEAVVVAVVVVI